MTAARHPRAARIGSLLADGLGDPVRVSLTEDPWHEIPVCKEIVRRAQFSISVAERLKLSIR